MVKKWSKNGNKMFNKSDSLKKVKKKGDGWGF
jgi:hypothetical protein